MHALWCAAPGDLSLAEASEEEEAGVRCPSAYIHVRMYLSMFVFLGVSLYT